MELRTKKLSDSIKVAQGLFNQLHVTYEPGNGSRYQFIVSPPVGASIGSAAGLNPASMFVSLLWYGKWISAPLVFRGGFLAWQYVAEKFGVEEEDARLLSEPMAKLLCRQFEPQGPTGPEDLDLSESIDRKLLKRITH